MEFDSWSGISCSDHAFNALNGVIILILAPWSDLYLEPNLKKAWIQPSRKTGSNKKRLVLIPTLWNGNSVSLYIKYKLLEKFDVYIYWINFESGPGFPDQGFQNTRTPIRNYWKKAMRITVLPYIVNKTIHFVLLSN